MNSLEHFSALLNCHNEVAWRALLLRFGSNLGFSQVLFAVIPSRQAALEKDNAFLCTSYNPNWLEWYGRNRMEGVDPVVAHCAFRNSPLLWSPEIYATQQQKSLYEEARSHGLRSGVSLPMHGANGEKGVFSFVREETPSTREQEELKRQLPELLLLRDLALDGAAKFLQPPALAEINIPQLTQRELECLKWCAAGKSSWEIGQILKCSEAVVNFHIGNVRRKFDVTSRRHAVAKAIQLGLINSL